MSEEEVKKPIWKKWWVWVVAAFVFIIIISALSGEQPQEPAKPVQEAQEAATETSETKQTTETKEETPIQPPTEKPKPKKWIKVIELSGNANKRSDIFELTGEEARLTYDVEGSTVAVAIFVVEEGTQLSKDGGFAEVTVTQAGKDSTILMKDPGNYYLDIIQAVSAEWSILIEEFK